MKTKIVFLIVVLVSISVFGMIFLSKQSSQNTIQHPSSNKSTTIQNSPSSIQNVPNPENETNEITREQYEQNTEPHRYDAPPVNRIDTAQ